jgi:hypothetical protein
MMTTHYTFRLLSSAVQLVVTMQVGTYLATRWEEEDAVDLYHLPAGFFVEVYYRAAGNKVERLHSFVSKGPLADYAVYIQLTDLE